jgi:hypothetical protein
LPINNLIVMICLLVFPLLFTNPNELYFNYYIKYILIVTYFFLLIFIIHINKALVIHSFVIFIVLHMFFFYSQLSYFLIFDTFLDFNNIVREVPSESLYLTKALNESSLIPIRATGLYSEPSFYAMAILPVSYYLLLNKRKYFAFAGFISAYLSLSIASIIISTICIAIYFFKEKGQLHLKGILIVIAIMISGYFYDFYDVRVSQNSDYDATESRSLIFQELSERGLWLNSIGAGLLLDENKPLGLLGLKGSNIRDSSFFVYLLFSVGWIGLILFFGLILFMFGRQSIIFVLPLLLLKFHLVTGTFWMVLILAYMNKKTEA